MRGLSFSRRGRRLNIEKRPVDWTFVFMFFDVLHFPILAVWWLQNTYYFQFLRLRRKHRETPNGLTLWNPMAANMGSQIDQVPPKNIDISKKCLRLLWRPEANKHINLFMHFGRPLHHFSYVWGSNWLPFAQLLVSSMLNTWRPQSDSASTLF